MLNTILQEFSGKTILLTGSTGLIGSYIVDSVYEFNKNSSNPIFLYALNKRKSSVIKRFSHIKDEFISFLSCGVENVDVMKFSRRIDFIIHAGSPADPLTFSSSPVETITANVNGTVSLLELARNNRSKFLLVSTREVYGFIENSSAYKENEFGLCDFNIIRSSYPESKRVAEILCRAYKEEYNVDSYIARLGYVYGETQTDDDSRVIAQFLRKGLKKENIIMKSDGLQRRCYTYVFDCVTAIFTILLKGTEDVYNVSNEDAEVSLSELASLIATITGTLVIRSKLTEQEKKWSSNPQNSILDCSRLRALGWSPLFGIKEGIESTLEKLSSREKKV